MNTENKSIIITGAGSGIGRNCAELFLEKGYNVGLIGRRGALLEEVAADRDNALVLPCDITDPASVRDAFDRAYAEWGHVDVLFNNAGVSKPSQTIDEISTDDWLEVVQVNLTGAFFCARESFRIMRAQSPQGGRIINNGSISAHVPRPGSVAYTSTKHAITGLTRSLSLDGRAFNIACGQIDIGNAQSDMTSSMSSGVPQANGSLAPEPTIDVRHISQSVLHMAQLPLEANVQFMTVMASSMPFIGRG